MAYRYRTTTALFPLVPPPPRPVYPRGAVIRRFAIGAILVAVFVFVLFFLLGAFLGASAGKTVGYALIAALVCAAPVSVCGVVLAGCNAAAICAGCYWQRWRVHCPGAAL